MQNRTQITSFLSLGVVALSGINEDKIYCATTSITVIAFEQYTNSKTTPIALESLAWSLNLALYAFQPQLKPLDSAWTRAV